MTTQFGLLLTHTKSRAASTAILREDGMVNRLPDGDFHTVTDSAFGKK
jgi:hypothetical protein